ncbi:MAG: cytochrome P450 [Chloroflexota bacterium]
MSDRQNGNGPVTTGTGPRVAPGPTGLPLLGVLPQIGGGDLIGYYVNAWRQYGDVVRVPLGPKTAFLLADPEHIKYVLVDNEKNYCKGSGFRKVRLALGEGLFTADGPEWRQQRRLMQPPFTPKAVTQFGPVMTDAIGRLVASWEERARGGSAFNVNAEMMRLAMAVIARSMFSIDLNEKALDAAHSFTFVLEFVSRHTVSLFDVPLFVPTAENRTFKESLRTLDAFVDFLVEERQRQGAAAPDDLLTTLMRARDPETGEGLSRRQIRDQVLTIFFAGHETTAQALTWAWYLLAQHPAVEERLQAEIDGVLGGRVPTAADAPNLKYTRMVLDETMRLYPPVWVFVRDAIADDRVGEYAIPAGSMVVLSQYITHRHPAYWPDPERFDPERFGPDQSNDRPRYAYFPFGGGPRTCLGSHFAVLEATLALATIAQRYRLRLLPAEVVEPRMVGTLRPGGKVMMTVEPR